MSDQSTSPKRIIGTQLYVWTQVCRREGASPEERLGRILGEAAAAGYEAVEPSLPLCAEAPLRDRFRHALQTNGLRPISFYSGGPFHDDAAFQHYSAETLRVARHAAGLGCAALCINPDVKRGGKTDDELAAQVRNLNRMGEALKELGMELWLHNHDPEMRDGARELRFTLDRSDPDLVRYCADVHWIFRGGGDPYDYLDCYGPRTGSLHVRNSRNGIWGEEFGDGDIDYRRVRAILGRHAFAGPIYVELAIEPGTPQTRPLVESARISCEYARAIFGA